MNTTTTSFTLADAAFGTGMLKSSILSAIKSCRLSGTRGEFGQLRIEAEELHRELAETRTRASLAEQRVADLTAMLDDMREQRDRWPLALTFRVLSEFLLTNARRFGRLLPSVSKFSGV